MTRILSIILSDLGGLCRVFGPLLAGRWLVALIWNIHECRRRGDLRAADLALGPGPFEVRLRSARARLVGPASVSNAREIWVRDVYLDGGWLTIGPSDSVIDLGANRGIFSLLALGHGPGVRVVSVEADPQLCRLLHTNLAVNGWLERSRIVNAFVGGRTDYQDRVAVGDRFGEVPWLDEAAFLQRCEMSRVDFLKCDIEGSEFGLLHLDSQLLSITDQLAVEVHREAGDAEGFVQMLEACGFRTRISRAAENDMIVLARRR